MCLGRSLIVFMVGCFLEPLRLLSSKLLQPSTRLGDANLSERNFVSKAAAVDSVFLKSSSNPSPTRKRNPVIFLVD